MHVRQRVLVVYSPPKGVNPRVAAQNAAMMERMTADLLPPAALEAFCRAHRIRRLAVFGSVLRNDFSDASDLDVLVEFEPGHSPGWEFFALRDELSALLGRRVDLGTFGGLYGGARTDILENARTLYDAA